MKKEKDHYDFTHPNLHQEIQAIGGHYVFAKEMKLTFGQEEVLVLIGIGVIDRSCCGIGGCIYALVPGFIRKWQYKTSKAGLPISQIEPIQDKKAQDEIRTLIEKSESVGQVKFQEI